MGFLFQLIIVILDVIAAVYIGVSNFVYCVPATRSEFMDGSLFSIFILCSIVISVGMYTELTNRR